MQSRVNFQFQIYNLVPRGKEGKELVDKYVRSKTTALLSCVESFFVCVVRSYDVNLHCLEIYTLVQFDAIIFVCIMARQMRFSLPSIKCSAAPPSFRILPSGL